MGKDIGILLKVCAALWMMSKAMERRSIVRKNWSWGQEEIQEAERSVRNLLKST